MLVFVSGLSQNTIDLSIPPSVFVSAEHPNQTTMATMDTLVSASDGRLHSRHKQSADSCSVVGKSALIAGEGEGGGAARATDDSSSESSDVWVLLWLVHGRDATPGPGSLGVPPGAPPIMGSLLGQMGAHDRYFDDR